MLTDEVIEKNKQRFIELIKSIDRDFDKDALIRKLSTSDFFTAPASTQYHCSYKGGLCEHSLNVYDQLGRLIASQYPNYTVVDDKSVEVDSNTQPFIRDSIIITALFHDLSKMNFYEVAERNTKDENGNWIKVPFIRTKAGKDRFLYGNHEQTSLFMISQFIPLTLDEEIAILHHMGGKGYDSAPVDLTSIYNRHTLALLLHLADMAATYITERL